jgi:signal transduction histidine kinase
LIADLDFQLVLNRFKIINLSHCITTFSFFFALIIKALQCGKFQFDNLPVIRLRKHLSNSTEFTMRANIIGLAENTPFDVRMFNTSVLIAALLTSFGGIVNLLNDFPLIFELTVWASAALFITLYYLSRFLKMTKWLKVPFVLVIFLTTANAWFHNEGIMGSTAYYLCYCVLAFPFMFSSTRYLILTMVICFAVGLILLHSFFPEWIMGYTDYQSRFIDNAVTLIMILLISSGTMLLFMKNLDREKAIIECQNQKLALQNEEITAQSEALKMANSELLELYKFKELMTGMVIHDLKNPLSSIIGLSNQKSPERNFQLIRQSGKQMLNLVMNILDIQKFENTRIPLNLANVNMIELFNRATGEVSGLIDAKNISIKYIGDYGQIVITDSELIERVLINILSNAIKYSGNNAEITISSEDWENMDFVKISVTDYGPGINPEHLEKVFDKFSQVSLKKTGSIRSTGLGLSFCKMAVEAHHCSIGVESDPGKSTTFWFTLKKGSMYNEMPYVVLENLSLSHSNTLSEIDKEYLKSFISDLSSLKFYHIGKLLPVLTAIDHTKSPAIERWKNDIENAVYSNNETQFKKLISAIDDEKDIGG